MHPNRAIREALVSLLSGAGIEVGTPPVPVTVVEHPPTNGWLSDQHLPGIYCFARAERISPSSQATDTRQMLFDIVLQSKGARSAGADDVDDMQLEVERAIAADPTLGWLCYQVRPVGSDIYLNQGEVVFAARRLSVEVLADLPRADPSI